MVGGLRNLEDVGRSADQVQRGRLALRLEKAFTRGIKAVAVLVAIAPAPGAAPAGAATPRMDQVEAAMRRVAPNLEGIAYQLGVWLRIATN
jgi:hypothetical protein